jgi:hypothetical protein
MMEAGPDDRTSSQSVQMSLLAVSQDHQSIESCLITVS